MDKESIKQIIIDTLSKRVEGLVEIYLFGSIIDTAFDKVGDIDVAYRSSKSVSSLERFNIQEEIASKLKKDVDLVDLQSVKTVFKTQIIYYGEVIYSTDEKATDLFSTQVIWDYIDYKEDISPILEEISMSGRVYG